MFNGFIKVAAITPDIRVADPYYNAERIMERMDEAEEEGVKLGVFPELCITGYTCEDLFYQSSLLNAAKDALLQIVAHSDGMDGLWFVGLPYEHGGKLYNVAAAINCGELLGLVPKTNLPMYGEFYEGRHFEPGPSYPVMTEFDGAEIPFGTDLLFESDAIPGLSVAAEICEDLWAPNPPSVRHALSGATVIVNLSASNELTGKDEYRKTLLRSFSGRVCCGYIYANAGFGESTQDLVFGGHNLIAENGHILAESVRFENGMAVTDLDIERIRFERRRINTFRAEKTPEYMIIPVGIVSENTYLTRSFAKKPFVPSDKKMRNERCEEILTIQAMGLAKRLAHTGCKSAVIGLSGGLDSTLAFLVTAKAYDILGLDKKDMYPVTMPGMGTTGRTFDNATKLSEKLGTQLKTVDIKAAVMQHFSDIGLDPESRDVTYENSQARERTQILMDIANMVGGMVIGTGDLSELALGWATYNGDHMSMYGVNGSIPKTLVRHLVKYYADTCGDEELSKVLEDILATPVSPELLPPKEGDISQKTEELVGPYTLHDFFLYYTLRWGFSPSKVYRLAVRTFAAKNDENASAGEGGEEEYYDAKTILRWLKIFYRRFFAQQFKRSCLPDGPKVGSVAVSPRGDLRMPSDAVWEVWKRELEEIEEQ